MTFLWRCGALAVVWFVLGSDAFAQVKPKFESAVVNKTTAGHAVDVDVDITGAKQLFLVINDAGDGFTADWADWAEPRLIGPKGELKLTELTWKQATTGFGQAWVNKNAKGQPLKIDGKVVANGIGAHANSLIEYDLPAGYTRFEARAGLDDGGVNQGMASSVRFLVYTERPAAASTRPATPEGGEPENAVAALDVAEGLEATLFAAEPMLLSPSDIDVDHLGRVWVCEVVNYRHRNGSRPEGDRILILEDTDHDGKADKQTVFYQGRDIDSALGICVLGNKVLVSVAPNVFIFTDEDGDGKADKKELLFSKVGQPQHDHSTHAFTFGPDGKLYWNVGNSGQAVHDKDGNPIVDMAGNVVAANGKPYRQGLVFRCNPDGSQFEVLGNNFRNNYEVAVDSFGTLWQSDNDDDGNRGVRINYVMEFGNFGYTDEITGAGWQTPRTNLEKEIPLRHWHQNDPGVVPNLLVTGMGSPTGICVYEGSLLPRLFQNQVIHCDAGPNVCRAYPTTKDGAGYKAEIADVLAGPRDKWYRPSDVCVAPDGSLLVADWYDPGVGGHRMGDIDKGRIFRVAPANAQYRSPHLDLNSVEGMIEGLKNPNLETRYLAWTALNKKGVAAEPALLKLFESSDNPRFRARALWLLSKIEGRGQKHIEKALKDADADIRITALRAERELNQDVLPAVKQLAHDSSPQVRRDCAIALRHNKSSQAAELWAELAEQYDAKDRWYLEALGISADGQWDAFLGAWLKRVDGKWNTPAGRDIIWRSRAAVSPQYLTKIIADPSVTLEELPRYFRALDFLAGEEKDRAIVQLAFETSGSDAAKQALVVGEAFNRVKGFDLTKNKEQAAALQRVLDQTRGTEQFVTLVDKFNVADRYPQLLATANENPDSQVGVAAIRVLLAKKQTAAIEAALANADVKGAVSTIRVLGNSQDAAALALLFPLVTAKGASDELRQEAVRAVAKSRNGANQLVKLAQQKKLDANLEQVTAFALHSSTFDDIKSQAAKLFPLPESKSRPLPPLAELLKAKGDAAQGKLVFNNAGTCAKCHVVNGEGKEVGPNLSEIGAKLSREALFESILFPSAGISHNYENYVMQLDNGNVLSGILTSQTPDEVSIKSIDAITRTFKRSEIEELKKQSISLMPADLQKVITPEELIDVVEYISTLKKAAK